MLVGSNAFRNNPDTVDSSGDPTDLKAARASGDISSGGSTTDGIGSDGQSSNRNSQSAKLLILNAMTNIDTDFKFVVHEYNPDEARHYRGVFDTDPGSWIPE